MPFRTFPRKNVGPAKSEKARKTSGAGPLFAEAPPTDLVTAHIDGGARGNPGPAGFGVHITDAHGKVLTEISEFLGHKTNNYAEYSALLSALEYARDHSIPSLRVVSDSEVVVRQMQGTYKVTKSHLKLLNERARQLVRGLKHFEIQHVLREQNKDADRLANEAMDRGSGSAQRTPKPGLDYDGTVRGGVVELDGVELAEGTRVKVRVIRS